MRHLSALFVCTKERILKPTKSYANLNWTMRLKEGSCLFILTQSRCVGNYMTVLGGGVPQFIIILAQIDAGMRGILYAHCPTGLCTPCWAAKKS